MTRLSVAAMQQIADWFKKSDSIDVSVLEKDVATIYFAYFALEAERVEGLSQREMIFLACLLLLCPIMMSITAAILGARPSMLETGNCWELRRQVPLAIVGGLIVSQVVTLFTISAGRLAVSGRCFAPPRARGKTLE